MRNILICSLVFFCLSTPALAQKETCDCRENLLTTITKTEENYAGFPAKVNSSTSATYQRLVETLKKSASAVSDPKKCYFLIKQYIDFFKDKHFILSYIADKDIDSSVVKFSVEAIKDRFKKKWLSPVEGIWINPDSTQKIAIQKTANGSYQAIKLDSKTDDFPAGFVYFTLTPNKGQFIAKEYNSFVSTATPAKLKGNLLQLWNMSIWGKTYPTTLTKTEAEEFSNWKNNNNGLVFKRLSDQVSYIKIPTFRNNDNAIMQLIAANDSVIRSTKHLIIDLSGNGGGNSGWIFLLPYLMTNPIHQESPYLRVTPDNVKMKLPDIEPFVLNPIGEEYRKYFPEQVLNQYKKAYAELPVTKEKFYPVPAVSFPLDSVTRFPEKVALIVDNFCGSSTEYFLYLSRQSKKVFSYGQNTIGMMDYEGMSNPTPLPYNKFILTIPIARSSWTDKQPIDQTGFKPDVRLTIPQNQWINFIMKDIGNRRK